MSRQRRPGAPGAAARASVAVVARRPVTRQRQRHASESCARSHHRPGPDLTHSGCIIQFQNSGTGSCVVTSHSTLAADLQKTRSGLKRSELAIRRAHSTLRRESEHRLHLRYLPRSPARRRRQDRHAMQRVRLAAHRGVRAPLLCALTPKIRRVCRHGRRLPVYRARTAVGGRTAGWRWSVRRGVAVGETIAD